MGKVQATDRHRIIRWNAKAWPRPHAQATKRAERVRRIACRKCVANSRCMLHATCCILHGAERAYGAPGVRDKEARKCDGHEVIQPRVVARCRRTCQSHSGYCSKIALRVRIIALRVLIIALRVLFKDRTKVRIIALRVLIIALEVRIIALRYPTER